MIQTGFGLPIAEAMLLGLPVITTDWGGQKDFCNDKNSWLIDYEFTLSKSHFNLQNSYWAEPSIQHLGILLAEIYNSSENAIQKKTIPAQDLIKSFTWDKVVDKNIQSLNNYFCRFDNRISKIGWVSTWSSKCGIASYSRRFLNYMPDDIYVFSPYDEINQNISDNINLVNENHVIPSWNCTTAKDQDLNHLFTQVKNNQISSLIIQFNFGFFNVNELDLFINKLLDVNINVIMILHSTIASDSNNSNYLYLLKDALKKCTRILVHSVNDLNRLKNLNLIDNVSLFTHPILDFENKKNKSYNKLLFKSSYKDKLHLVSYGFCLPGKGFPELIQAINILRNSHISFRLDVYSAIYSEEYQYVFQELVDLVNQLELNHLVNLSSEYIPENQLLSTLSKHDLIIFPYQISNESSSASVRDGLASMKPVIVTPLSIFDEISDLVNFFKGTSPDDIANGLIEWYECQKAYPHIDSEKHLKRIQKINQRRYSLASQKLSSMINSLEINQ